MSRPLVSIVVNVYNGERYVAECLDSILRLDGNFPLQVIVVDDASTDGTADILTRYRRSRFEMVRLDRNRGAAAAINHAFTFIRSEFLARIDYDDRYHANFLVESLAALKCFSEAAFVCASANMIDQDGVPGATIGPGHYGEEPGVRDRFVSMLARHFVTAPTILGRTEHWRRAIPIPADMNFCDWYMNLTMAEVAPVAVIDKITADYRIHPLNMHSTKIADGMGERVTFQVLDRSLLHSPRRIELAPHASRITALHYADWGDKYFGAGMDDDALRCYRAALASDRSLAWKGKFLHRYIGLIAGRKTYEDAKRIAHRILRRRPSEGTTQ